MQRIDQVLQSVHAMVSLIDSVNFAIFDKAQAHKWQEVKAIFNQSNEEIKEATRDLIDTSFRCAAVPGLADLTDFRRACACSELHLDLLAMDSASPHMLHHDCGTNVTLAQPLHL